MTTTARSVSYLNHGFGPAAAKTVVGFSAPGGGHHHQQHGFAHACGDAGAAQLARGRSLLSELLSKEEAACVAALEAMSCASSSAAGGDECASACDSEHEEDWEWWQGSGAVGVPSACGESTASNSSAPIPIPASCYFKDQVQREALTKLMEKRKWYQQQLEAERMQSKSLIPKGAAAAKSHKPPGRPGAPA